MKKWKKTIENEYKERKTKLENEAISKLKRNPKFFYSYAKKHSKSKSQIGPFFDEEGELITDQKQICNILRKQYESVSSKPDERYLVDHPEEFFFILVISLIQEYFLLLPPIFPFLSPKSRCRSARTASWTGCTSVWRTSLRTT